MVAEVLTMTTLMLNGIKFQKDMIDGPREVRRFTRHVKQQTCSDDYLRRIRLFPGMYCVEDPYTLEKRIHDLTCQRMSLHDIKPMLASHGYIHATSRFYGTEDYPRRRQKAMIKFIVFYLTKKRTIIVRIFYMVPKAGLEPARALTPAGF